MADHGFKPSQLPNCVRKIPREGVCACLGTKFIKAMSTVFNGEGRSMVRVRRLVVMHVMCYRHYKERSNHIPKSACNG